MDINRGTGRTTRLADKAIQELFTTGSCHVVDDSPIVDDSRVLMDKILGRLSREHFRNLSESVEIDRKKSIIKLKN